MSRRFLVRLLEKEYARLKGEYNEIEKEIESVVGKENIIDKQNEIFNRQRKMMARMLAIKNEISVHDPNWDPFKVKPIIARKRSADHGARARLINELIREQEGTIYAPEIIDQICSLYKSRGQEIPTRQSLYRSVYGILTSLEGEHLERLPGRSAVWQKKK